MIVRTFRVNPEDVAYVKYIFEGYEGMVTVTTLEKRKSIIQVAISQDFIADVEQICKELKSEIMMHDM